MNRAYCVSDWSKDFAKAFAASIPMEAMPTRARGVLLASANEEPEEDAEAFFARADAAYAERKASGELQRERDHAALREQQQRGEA